MSTHPDVVHLSFSAGTLLGTQVTRFLRLFMLIEPPVYTMETCLDSAGSQSSVGVGTMLAPCRSTMLSSDIQVLLFYTREHLLCANHDHPYVHGWPSAPSRFSICHGLGLCRISARVVIGSVLTVSKSSLSSLTSSCIESWLTIVKSYTEN